MAAQCAARQLTSEGSLKSVVSDLEAKVAALEREKAALQQRLDKSAAEKATLTTELLAMAERAVQAEDAREGGKEGCRGSGDPSDPDADLASYL